MLVWYNLDIIIISWNVTYYPHDINQRFFSNLVWSNNLTFLRYKNQMKNRKHYTVGTIPSHRGIFQWMCYILIMRSSIIPILCLFPKSRVAEREKLYHTYCMFMFYIVCIRKRETASYLQYIYVLDLVYQKERNCIIPTVYLCSRFCVSERERLYHTWNMFMFYIVCIRQGEAVSCIQYVYVLDFVYL